ncbi:MAG: ribosome biogenesis GTPase Der [Verrucomicrobiae bacterium]|nr:ribosome biogenesis GTPase Der [Verrucomicrobiae bacterium]MCP5539711.1 ribosome biogenesis GTPase Der [Akkermansiaceae bacterium]MCP5549448.1 ribosome biogenesis GTPase Der [Akkermansiaceae bacterium]
MPRVAIAGRPNVGKSALFNRLAGRTIAIVHDQPGVTRDRIAVDVRRNVRIPFELTDTGGIGATLDDGFASQVRIEADIAIETADVILFVVDAREGLTSIDENLAAVLRRSGRRVLLVANKVDTAKTEPAAAEFASLGFGAPIAVSAAHGRHFDDLRQSLESELEKLGFSADRPNRVESATQPCSIAIVGRPNVGKSSLINAILNDERTIVSEVAGTTRDAVDVPYERDGSPYVLIDTAGIRRRAKMDTSVEVFSSMRSERSIRRADLCLLVVDASSGVVAQDRRIARTILDANKPCIVVLNKFDLYHPDARFHDRIEQFQEEIGEDLFFVPYAPRVAVSAKQREFLGMIFKTIEKVRRAAQKPISTGVLNRLLRDAIDRNPPPAKGGKRLKLLYATQRREDRPRAIPTPEYVLFVNYANLLTRTYQRYLEAQMREAHPMEGLPFAFRVRSRQGRNDKE